MSVAAKDKDVEQKIIEITAEICGQLNSRLKPRDLLWDSKAPIDEPFFSRDRRRNTLILSQRLKGSLEPEELRPLITASVISWSLERGADKLKLRLARLAGLPLILISAFMGLFLSTYYGLNHLFVGGFLSIYFFAALFSLFQFIFKEVKNAKFAGDREASKIVGQQDLLRVLQTIQKLKTDYPKEKGLRKTWEWLRLIYTPRLEERIIQLESTK